MTAQQERTLHIMAVGGQLHPKAVINNLERPLQLPHTTEAPHRYITNAAIHLPQQPTPSPMATNPTNRCW